MQDQTTILNMLAEGQLTVDEADALLAALADDDELSPPIFRSKRGGHFAAPVPPVPPVPPAPPRFGVPPLPPVPPIPPHPDLHFSGGRKRKRQMTANWSIRTSELEATAAALGIEHLSDDDVQRLRQHGVKPTYIEALANAGLQAVTLDDLIQLSMHGVKPSAIQALYTAGITDLSVDDLIQLSIHGVKPQMIGELRELGIYSVSMDDLIQFSIHGVKPAYVAELRALGLDDLSTDDLIQLAIHGVKPPFVADLIELGLTDLSVDSIVQMRIHGVKAGFVEGWQAAGITPLDPDDLIQLRIHGIKPKVVNRLVKRLHRLRDHGDDAELVRLLINADVPQFVPDFAETVTALGFEAPNTRQRVDLWLLDMDQDELAAARADHPDWRLNELIEAGWQAVRQGLDPVHIA